MKPIVPFEPVGTEVIPTGPSWIGQLKWDGVRVLTYYNGKTVKLYNRKLNERTLHYPELTNLQEYCSADSVILDGEIIALKNGKPSFYEVMKRDGNINPRNIESLRKEVPITYMIFDVVYCNGQWVTSNSLTERQKLLDDIITPNNHVLLVESFADTQTLYDVIKAHDMEGIIAKDLSSTYKIGGKDQRWMKKKNYKDLIAVVGGVTLRNSIVNSLLLGLFDHHGLLRYIGSAGTGKLTQKEWRDFTELINSFIQPRTPFANLPRGFKKCVWLQPKITVKIKFTGWTEDHSLRQPSIQAFVDVPVSECSFDNFLIVNSPPRSSS